MTDSVDNLLQTAGERWRNAQPEPPTPDTARFVQMRSGDAAARRWTPAVVLASLGVVLVILVVPVLLRSGRHTPADGYRATDSGPRVEAVGTLLEYPDGRVQLCGQVLRSDDRDHSLASCVGMTVAVAGADGTWFTSATKAGQRLSGRIRVLGTYRDGTLLVSQMLGPAPEPSGATPDPQLPCPPPDGGWSSRHGFPDQKDEQQATRRLAALIETDPERFSDLWQ